MKQQIVSQTGVGSSTTIPMNLDSTPFNVGFGVTVTGTVTYTVQHSFDPVWQTDGVTTWYNHPTIASLSANADGNYAFPVSAIKIVVTAGTGTVQLTVIQAGIA